MIVLDKTKTLSTLVNDTTNGVGKIQPLSCIVTEELNGIYECEFTLPTTDKHYQDLKTNMLVKLVVNDYDDEQIFRIYYISEPINFVVTCKGQHISYDLSKIPVKPFTAQGSALACNLLMANVIGTYPFTITTNISNTTSTFTLDIPRSFRECLGGYEGSLLDVFRGEYEWDNLEVKMLSRRGADNNVRISYGKNLTDFVQEENNENVYDAVYGYAVVDDVTYEASSIYNKTSATYPKVLNVDFSSNYQSGNVPTGAELLSYATTYATDNDIEIPKVNMKISFVPLWQSDEYKNILPLERVKLGDTVHVYFDKLGVEASARVIKTEWNALTEKYDSIELGDAKANLNTVINQSVDTAVESAMGDIDTTSIMSKVTAMSNLIANGLGLRISTDSQNRIILHNAETIALSQYQYYISSAGLMVSDDYGQTWNSGWTISGDAYFNAISSNIIESMQIYGSYIQGSQIVFGDPNDDYVVAQPYILNNDSVGISFDGSGYVRFQPHTKFEVYNLSSTDAVLNSFVMESRSSDSVPNITLTNFTNAGVEANRFKMTQMTGGTYISLTNMLHDDPTKKATTFTMNSFGSPNTAKNVVYLNVYDTSETLVSYLNLQSTGATTLKAAGDLSLQADGAVRINSSGSQDVTIYADDDLHITWGDKLYLNGNQVYLSGGYLRY